jgi:hypothetical protein
MLEDQRVSARLATGHGPEARVTIERLDIPGDQQTAASIGNAIAPNAL